MLSARIKLIVLSILMLLAPCGLTAEFIATAPGVYQSTSTLYRLIVSYDVTGIFILVTKPIGLQTFDPTTVKREDSQHLFLAYNSEDNRYDQLIYGEMSKRIIGSFTLLMNGLRISLDHNNTYLTVSSEQDQSIVGFRGLQVLFSTTGEVASLLAANEFAEYSKLILPYELVKSGSQQELLLDKKPVKNQNLGLSIQSPNNPCSRNREFLLLTSEDVKKLKTIKNAGERSAFLGNAFVRNIENNLLGNSIQIRATKDAIVYFDPNDLVMSSLAPMRTRFDNKIVCIKTDFQL